MTRHDLPELATRLAESIVKAGLDPLQTGSISVADRSRELALIQSPRVEGESNRISFNIPMGAEDPDQFKKSHLISAARLHSALYQAFPNVTAIAKFRSSSATAWSQAGQDIPCLGGEHASLFRGTIPCTRQLSPEELCSAEPPIATVAATVLQALQDRELSPIEMGGVLILNDGPIVWGKSVSDCLRHAIGLERVAELASRTLQIRNDANPLPARLLDLHFSSNQGPV